jgi:hypothetical protein
MPEQYTLSFPFVHVFLAFMTLVGAFLALIVRPCFGHDGSGLWHAEQGIVQYAEAADRVQYACKFFASRVAYGEAEALYKNTKLAGILVPAVAMSGTAVAKLKNTRNSSIAPFIVSVRGAPQISKKYFVASSSIAPFIASVRGASQISKKYFVLSSSIASFIVSVRGVPQISKKYFVGSSGCD